MRTAIQVCVLYTLLHVLAGCGLARAVSLNFLAEQNTPCPPQSKLVNKEISTLLAEHYPTIYLRYSSKLIQPLLVDFYVSHLSRNGWKSLPMRGQDAQGTMDDSYRFHRGDALVSITFVPGITETVVDVELWNYPWIDYNVFRLGQGLVWTLLGDSSDPIVLAFIQLF